MVVSSLDRDTIVVAALKILAEKGIAAVSLRNVAAEVGVRAPSLYWHVPSKPALFGYMSESIFRQCLDSVPISADWREWLRALGVRVWQVQRTSRDMHLLMMQSYMEPAVLQGFTSEIVAKLVTGGLPRTLAFDAQKSVLALASGWTMMPNDPAFIDRPPEPSFLHCLDAVIVGWDKVASVLVSDRQ
jgi:TetR/AcrR family transcriptional regulator, tetracycline repressor protein